MEENVQQEEIIVEEAPLVEEKPEKKLLSWEQILVFVGLVAAFILVVSAIVSIFAPDTDE